MTNIENLITEIIEYELEMFLAVQAREKVACQENPEGFKFYRRATFSVWSEDALTSYRNDLIHARERGRNLLTLKYARMEDLIPVINDNELIDDIVDITINWIKEMAGRYPNIHKRGRPIEEDGPGITSTKTYLKSELETYSDNTLKLHHKRLKESMEKGENLSEKVYLEMVKGSGFDSIQAAENHLAGHTMDK